MSTPTDSLPRRVVPRWRDFHTSAQMGELDASGKQRDPVATIDDLPTLRQLWKDAPTSAIAGEIVSTALVGGNWDQGHEAAKFILAKSLDQQSPARDAAETLLSMEAGEIAFPKSSLKSLRAALKANPRDPLAWCDLARWHATIGNDRKAEREITIALGLGRTNRFLIRSAVRCFLHLGQADRALQILHRNPLIEKDPWIAAALIATHSILGKGPRRIEGLRTLAQNSNIRLEHRTELLASLGTLELESGNSKRAKKLIADALRAPNENVLAQGLWTSRNHFQLPFDEIQLTKPRAFEANTLNLIQSDDWEGALSNAELWIDDEPFAGRPAIEYGFIKSVIFEEHEDAVNALRMALKSNKNDLLIANNLAFSLAQLGRLKEASQAFPVTQLGSASDEMKIALVATAGLISFREGNTEQGRSLYEAAARFATRIGEHAKGGLVVAFHALEERRAGTDRWQSLRSSALEELSKSKGPVQRIMSRKLESPEFDFHNTTNCKLDEIASLSKPALPSIPLIPE